MTWTRLSDDFNDRPENLTLSRSARLLLVEALVYCNRVLSDGWVPAAALPRFTDSPRATADADELVAAGLWHEDDRGGWQIDWGDQETAERVRKRRQDANDRQERARLHRSGDHCRCSPERDCRVTRDTTRDATRPVTPFVTVPRPDPTRPDPKESGRVRVRPAADELCSVCGKSEETCNRLTDISEHTFTPKASRTEAAS